MTDDLLGRELATWLRSLETGPPEPRLSLRRTMANVGLTPQARPSRLAAIVARDAIPAEPARHRPADRPVPAATHGGTSRMLITATAMAVTTALVLTGSVLLSGLVEESSPPFLGATPEPTTQTESLLVASDTVADDRFELAITTPRTTWAADEPIEVETTLAYIGQEESATVTSGGPTIVVFEVEQLDGPIDSGTSRDMSCERHELARGDIETYPFQKGGGYDPQGEMADFWRSWFGDPDLRLPVGTYRVIAHAAYGPPECGEATTLDAAVTIEVVDEPLLVASETVADDIFELTMATPRTTWAVDEPIGVEATLAYIGEEPEAEVWSTFEIVVFKIDQLDGPIDNGGFRRLVCARHELSAGDVETIPFQKSGSYVPDGEMGEFWQAWFDDPELRLPAGTYRLIASAEHGGRSCSDMATLEAAVTIEVVDAPANEAEVDWGPLAVISEGGGLDAGMGPGKLVIDDECVTLIGDGSDVGITLVWPGDQTSWIAGDRQVLFEHHINGAARLSDGDRVTFGGNGLGGDSPEVAEQVATWLESVWVQPPASSCPSALWLVGEVRPVPRVELVNPDGRVRGVPARAREAVEARSDYAGLYVDRQRGRLPVLLFTGDIDEAIELLRRRTRDDAKFEVREVERSLAELKATQRTIVEAMDDLRRQGIRVVEVGQDIRRNQVFVGVLGNVDKASARISELADPSSFRVERVTQPKTPES